MTSDGMNSDGMHTTAAERGQRRDRLLFLGSGLLILIALLVGLARAQRWGTRYVDVYIQAKDVNGLKRGEEIRIAGIPVGQVGRLQLTDQGKVTVQLQIDDSKAFLVGPSSKVRLAQEGLMGNPYVVISADPRPKDQGVTINGRTLHYAEPINLDRLLHEFAATQKQLRLTLRHTAELTEANGDIATAFAATRQLAEAMEQEITATAPVVRESMASVAKDVQEVSASTAAVERDAHVLMEETRPLIVKTIKDADQLTRSSQQVIDLLRNLLGPWLEPADGHRSTDASTD